MTTEDTEALV